LRELEEMVSCGMTPGEALIASTRTAAQLLGVEEDRGVIEPGKRADIVIVSGEALDVSSLGQRMRTVVQDGKVVAENG
ncbi:MAG: amidohydrolase family protein, partial [Ilumatobacteraceae bacterium]